MDPILQDRLDKIKSPKLQNQRETAIVLKAIEDTLRDQSQGVTPTTYFAALLALLKQAIPSASASQPDSHDGALVPPQIVNVDLATSVVYLLDLFAPFVPAPLLRSKFQPVLSSLAPALAPQSATTAPLLRHALGCLEALLRAQDAVAWSQLSTASTKSAPSHKSAPSTQKAAQANDMTTPRAALAAVLALAIEHRPKVRRRALDVLTNVLRHPPPSPSVDHPASDLCAETALHHVQQGVLAVASSNAPKAGSNGIRAGPDAAADLPSLVHALQLMRSVAAACDGWPTRRLDALCEVLLNIARSRNEYLARASFEIFETVFVSMADSMGDVSVSKLPKLLEALAAFEPPRTDVALLPPWLGVLARGYDVAAQADPEGTFSKLPDAWDRVCSYLDSQSHEVRVSAAECLMSLCTQGIPSRVLLASLTSDKAVLTALGDKANDLLGIRFQTAWMEVFQVLAALLDSLKWLASPLLNDAVRTVGELRTDEGFHGHAEADALLRKAITAMGPENVLRLLPLNLGSSKAGQVGRAWLLPLLRDSTVNANLTHFRAELVPLAEALQAKRLAHGAAQKSMTTKIYETLVQQIWALLPGYCTFPLDLTTAFDQSFAEMLANILYQHPDLRVDVCKGLQLLVETNQQIIARADEPDSAEDLLLTRVSASDARRNLEHLALFASNLLAVLFNVYSQTLPQFRGYILQCIDAYLGIMTESDLLETFSHVANLLDAELQTTGVGNADKKAKNRPAPSQMPPTSHTLMDLIITLAGHLPRPTFAQLFPLASRVLSQAHDTALHKKAYKLLPRLASTEAGKTALGERCDELQSLLLSAAATAAPATRRDRLLALSAIVEALPSSSLHFIPTFLSEVVLASKEGNERARAASFDLLILMGRRMAERGVITQSQIPNMPEDAPKCDASLAEYFTMVSAGLAGSTPHMISATVTALARVLYEFHQDLSASVVQDLLQTLFLFLDSQSREIVRSVFGFVKVAVTRLPEDVIRPHLGTLIPRLVGWNQEHKNQFQVKVRHLFERLIRRFGYSVIELACPESDRKLVHAVQKNKERKKRRKNQPTSQADGDDDDADTQRDGKVGATARGRLAPQSAFDAALEDSSDDDDDDDENDDDAAHGNTGNAGRGPRASKSKSKSKDTYIIDNAEDDDEPLDLLDRRALSRITSFPPSKSRAGRDAASRIRASATTDADGKLIFRTDNTTSTGHAEQSTNHGADADLDDNGANGGVGAYVAALRGPDAVRRGRGGRLKFDTKRRRGEPDIDEDAMDLDKGPSNKSSADKAPARSGASAFRGGRSFSHGNRGSSSMGKHRPERRGLDGAKVHGSRASNGSRTSGYGGKARAGAGHGRGASRVGGVRGGRVSKSGRRDSLRRE